MRVIVLTLLSSAALSASALAQTPPAPADTAPPAPAAAPAAAPQAVPAMAESAPGAPANICAELVAFLTPKPPPTAAANAPPQAPPPQKAEPNAGSAQQSTGQSGVAVEAPKEGGGTQAPAGGVNSQAPQQSGISAPVPKKTEENKKKPSINLEQAQALAQSNDIAACHEAVRKERRAGVDLPPPLISLAALDLKYHQQAASAAPSEGSRP